MIVSGYFVDPKPKRAATIRHLATLKKCMQLGGFLIISHLIYVQRAQQPQKNNKKKSLDCTP